MFTGIIEETGTIKNISLDGRSGSIRIDAEVVMDRTELGDSIAVNGVCLTVTSRSDRGFTADVMAETLRRSNLGDLKPGDRVNLERAMAAIGRFGGHIVSGHIDGTGTVTKIEREGNATWVFIKAPDEILRLIVEKGSICLDGISLTVAKLGERDFAISIIPHTAGHTTLLDKKVGDVINIENDIVGKYVQRLMGFKPAGPEHRSSITEDFLRENGF